LIARNSHPHHKLTDATAVLNTAVDADVDTIYARTLLAKIKNGDYDASPAPSGT
jgi:phosphoheptose isomerase